MESGHALQAISFFAGAELARMTWSQAARRALIRDRTVIVAVVIFGLIQAE